MKKSPLINLKQTATEFSLNLSKRSHPETNSGFTLIEVLVVVIIIGVLSAIAAPGWLAFVNRQRVNKVNDAILSALQDAQREARRTKTDYSVSFRTNGGVSEVAVHRSGTPPADTSPQWKSLTGELGINSEQVVLFSNLVDSNQAGAQGNIIAANETKTITFNYLGALPDEAKLGPDAPDDPNDPNNPGNTTDLPGLVVGVAIPQDANTVIAATKRCVKVRTLIGGIQTASGEGDAECP